MANYRNDDLTEMVMRAVEGDPLAWNSIVDRMDNMVWSVVRSFRMSDADSQDAAQMTWLRATENLHKVRDPERLGLWIATTARRESLRLLGRKKRVVPTDFDEARYEPEPQRSHETDVIDRDEVSGVLAALKKLGDDCQALLRLVLSPTPMNYAEIAAALDIAVGTIGPRRARCLSQLRAAASQA